ncbi:AraC family transcriptional regulator [Saccharothrix mutabilis subsp. mutabilis]|uniref:AraC family transcriptional regulator n=1 Tax=Saccharothrix mutabilis subsp. mutabilis TaxID=66855 RepID=A0ABP3E172_9PSEU
MDEAIVESVERVIRVMQGNLGEPITIDDMARTAMFSKFHFSRMFLRVTGVSPRRFLSALRLQEAKRLLLTSSLTVADISHVVGYNSIGTFSSRFSLSVGVSPTTYRKHCGYVPPLEEHPRTDRPARDRHPVLRGSVQHPPEFRPRRVVLGLFPERIARGLPVRHTTLDGAGGFGVADVPDGTWYLIARAVGLGVDAEHDTYVAVSGPIKVTEGRPVRPVDVRLRRKSIFDPPALLAHLDEAMLAISAGSYGRTLETASTVA